MKERLHYVDVCKGLLILMVIWQHIPLYASWMGVESGVLGRLGWDESFWFVGVYMQAFFLVNGYTSNFNKDFKPFLNGSAKALLVPYVAFSLIAKGLYILLWGGEKSLWVKTTGEGDQVWFFMDDSYWFLTALFMARILYWLLRCYIKKECYVGLAALVIMLIGFFLNHIYDGVALDPAHYNNHLHYRNALCMMIFIWIGEYLKNHKEKLKKYFAPASIAYVVFILMSHLIGRFGAPVYAHSCNIPYHRIPLYLFYATIGSVCFLWIAWKIKANKVLEYLGKGSLVVYICHFGYLRVVIKFLPLVLSPYEKVSGFIFFFITLLLVALLCAATIWVLNHKYLKVLIGKF